MRPYNRHQTNGERATPATRATVDSILNRLDQESPYASMLHEEIPDWLDIERRPTPKPTPQPVLKPKEKTVIPVTITESPKPKRGKPHPKTDLEEPARAEVAAALKRAGRGPCSVSAELFRHTGMAQWLKTGKGLSAHNVAIALEWARNVIALPDEPEEKSPPDIVEWFLEEGQGVNETPKGCRVTCGRLRAVVTHTGGRWRRDNLDGARARLEAIRMGAAGVSEWTYELNGRTLPGNAAPKRRQVISHFANGEAVYAWEDVEEEPAPAFDPEPCTKLETLALVADPAAFVLETWAASKLTYAMETLGLAMPEGYRFRVTVERVAAAGHELGHESGHK